MAIRYTNRYRDALSFCTVLCLRSVSLLAFILAMSAFVAWIDLPEHAAGVMKVVAFGVLTSIVFVVLLALQLLFNVYWLATNADRNFLTEHSVELTDEIFISSTRYSRVEIKWPGVFAIHRALNRLFVFEGPSRGHCIPASAFPSKSEFDAFAARAMELWHSARTLEGGK